MRFGNTRGGRIVAALGSVSSMAVLVTFGSTARTAAQEPPSAGVQPGLGALVERCWKSAPSAPREALELVAGPLGRAEGSEAAAPLDAAVAELRLCRGYAREQSGDLTAAARDYEAAVTDGERLQVPRLLGRALAQRGEMRYYQGDPAAALTDLDRAYRIAVEGNDLPRQRYLLNAIANVYADARVGAYDRALKYYRELLAVREAEGNDAEAAVQHFNIASTLERQGELEAAYAAYARALALDRRRGDPDEVAYDERALAGVLVKLGRSAEALPLLDAALARFEAAGDPESAAQARLTRGVARRSAGDLAGALADLDRAGEQFRGAGNRRYLAKVEEERAAVLAGRGDWRAAHAALASQLELERGLAEAMRDEHTTRMRVRFDSEKVEADNAALVRENELRTRALDDAERIRSLQRLVIWLAGGVLALLLVLVARQIAHARRMQALAMTDELTRLPNRRHLLLVADAEIEAARRHGAALSILGLDIDHFKRINDTLGHDAGDAVLKRVAQAARAALRGSDRIGRIGGEEFAAVLPKSGGAEAREIAERVRAAVEALELGDIAAGLRVTVSIGVATATGGESLAALLRRADEALYRAKSSGRNRVEPATGAA